MPKSTILCVDDEKIILNSLKSQLKSHFGSFFNYEIASSAEEALEIIEDLYDSGVQILVIVSDWLMPGIKGDEFLITVHSKYPAIVKLLLSGQADETAIENAYKKANLRTFITKPWEESELIRIIDSCIEDSQL